MNNSGGAQAVGAAELQGEEGEAGLGAFRQDFKSGLQFIYLFIFKGPEHLLRGIHPARQRQPEVSRQHTQLSVLSVHPKCKVGGRGGVGGADPGDLGARTYQCVGLCPAPELP